MKTEEKENEMLDLLDNVESNARTYANDFHIVIKSGKYSKVVDTESKVYIDCLGGAGTLALGHNHPVVVDAITDFINSGYIMHGLDLATPIKYKFVQTLLDCFPKQFADNAKIQFCGPTGADAVEACIKLFKTYTGRENVLAFHGCYHGMTAGTLSLTGSIEAKSKVSNLMPGVHYLPFPYMYRCPFGMGNEQSIDVNLAYIESVLSDTKSGITKPALMIVEVIQGEGGCIPSNDRWIRGLRDLTYKYDIPLVIDEIQTGFGRTGHMFAFESSGIIPDAVVVSKAVGGGLPLSLLLYNKKYDVWKPGAHAGTFRGNQLAMAAGIATMEYIKQENLAERSAQLGDYIMSQLRSLFADCRVVGEVRGRGLMIGIEIVDPSKPKDRMDRYPNAPELVKVIKRRCLENGVIIESGGRYDSVLRLLPPLIITEEEVDEVLDVLSAAIRSVC